jgi:hypothetical protein
MVGKNMDRSLDEIGRWKNRKTPSESTWKYQIGGKSNIFGEAGTKICGIISILFSVLFSNKGKSVILVLSFKVQNSDTAVFTADSAPSWVPAAAQLHYHAKLNKESNHRSQCCSPHNLFPIPFTLSVREPNAV